MIEFALLFTCFRKLGPGFRKPSAGPVAEAYSQYRQLEAQSSPPGQGGAERSEQAQDRISPSSFFFWDLGSLTK